MNIHKHTYTHSETYLSKNITREEKTTNYEVYQSNTPTFPNLDLFVYSINFTNLNSPNRSQNQHSHNPTQRFITK